jgi:hypothetical protein
MGFFPELVQLTTFLYMEVLCDKRTQSEAGTRCSVSDLWSRSGGEV